MATTTQRLEVELIVDSKGAIAGLKGFNKAVDGTEKNIKNTQNTMQKSESGLKKFRAGWLAVAGAVVGVTKVFATGIKKASEFEEVNAKFGTVFRGVEKQAESMAKELESAYGLSVIESRKFLASTQDLLVPMGLSREAAAKFSGEVAKLSVDLGSFNNMPTAQVMADIQSALVGNFETTKKYGVVLNETAIKQRIFEDTGVRVKGVVDAQTKALTALKLIQEGSADAQGDFIRTQGSFANQTKILGSNIENLAVSFGNKLIPLTTGFIKTINELLTPTADLNKQMVQGAIAQIKQADATDKLIDRYIELEGKTDRTAEENEEFRSIAEQIAKQLPDTVTEINDLTGAYKINAEGARQANEQNRQFNKNILQTGVFEASENLKELTKTNEKLNESLKASSEELLKLRTRFNETGEETKSVSTGVGFATVKLSDTIKSLSDRTKDLGDKITTNKSKMDTYRATLKQAKDAGIELDKETQKLIETYEKLNETPPPKPPKPLGDGGDIQANLEEFNQYLKESRQAEMTERELALESEKESYELALANLKDNLDKRLISEIEYEEKEKELMKQHEKNKLKIIQDGVKEQSAEDRLRQEKAEANAKAFRDAWNTAIGQTVSTYAQGITEMIFSGEMWRKNFVDFMKDMLIAIGKLIVQLLITKAIMASLGGIGLIAEDGGLVPKAEEGGLLTGASHAQGGVNIEAEGGEYIVSKKNVTSETLPLLRAINSGFKGTSQMAIANTPYSGYANGGIVDQSDNSKSSVVTIENVTLPNTNAREFLNELVEAGDDMGVNIINRGQA